ncbi:GyrI-like domain-containing protein [Eubacteriales bacterium OttesenSCG-928-G02]|nr:GyrI-like domain-containing protein [Eubacteriales bacterium OttesenSCG-928-G02]
MSEPVKKANQTPESYSPKVKPEILNVAESVLKTLTIENEKIEIIAKKFQLVGFEAEIDLKDSHWQGMDDVKSLLKANIEKFANKINSNLFIGMWEADPNADYSNPENHSKRLYFYGIEVSDFQKLPKGCVVKDFPESVYAVFKVRSHGVPKYEWLDAAGYSPDRKFQEKYMLDMEIFYDIDDIDNDSPSGEKPWDMIIPVRESEEQK